MPPGIPVCPRKRSARGATKKVITMEPFAPKPVEDCFHVYSDGTRVTVLCETDEDFVFIMNLLAVVSFYCHLKVLSLEVMRTHFHIIVRGREKDVEKFKREIKRLIVRRYNRIGLGELVQESIIIQADPIRDDEELRRKIIYVFRNCTEAGYEFLPEDYEWGPGQVYCRKETKHYRKVSGLDYRDQCRLFKTRVKLPGNWEYDQKGMLVPASYIDKEFLQEQVFRTPRQFIAFLSVRKHDLAEMEAADARPFLERKEEGKLLQELKYTARKQFGTELRHLSQSNRVVLATHYWNEGKTHSIKQLARLTKINVEVLRAILHVPEKT